jgi:hypothetical protein
MSEEKNNSEGIGEEFKNQIMKPLSKFDYDLYHEEDDVAFPIVRVKRIGLPNNGERWKIFKGNTVLMVIEGGKLTKKERGFLRSVEGVNFLINQFKINLLSFHGIKQEIKKEIKRLDKNKK